MEDSENQYSIFLELRQRLQSGLLIIRNDVAKSSTNLKVSFKDSALDIHTPTGTRHVELPRGISLAGGSCPEPSGTEEGDGLHFRLRLRVNKLSDARGSVFEKLRATESYCFLCQACGSRVLMERAFGRVLPLPNGNWNALVDDWCCHPDPFANRKLIPRADDCLLGDTYVLLSRDRNADETLFQETRAEEPTDGGRGRDAAGEHKPRRKAVAVGCKSCGSSLGEVVTDEVLKLYITEVVVKQNDERDGDVTEERLRFLEHTLGARLVKLSSAQSVFRFSIQTPASKAHILLWLLNADTLVAWFSDKSVNGDAPVSTSDSPATERQSCLAHGAVKVLYLSCTPSKHQDIIDAWEKDIGVHPLTLPLSTCEEVLRLLRASTSCLPASLRSMNSYQVAYLRL
ncbi:E3 ubiquitin-protein ligase E3D [Chanos chanos]|uniref:E3 ubiquitin-protein ligase E3D n=1 Tax=Chanos chanos TaxID=29144 RepID=A0A6J2WBV0_CHACN|nr:E3 ubiquitin-protein ligase E3D [Chanos chanos]